MARKTRQIETRMMAEYLLQYYSKFPRLTAVPLGSVSDTLMASVGYQKAIGLSRPFRPEVDAIVILPNYLLLLEAKVFKVVDGCAKLPLYKSLVPTTPELKQYLPREIIMQLVVGWSSPNLETMAAAAGVQLKTYAPPWLDEIVQSYHRYWTAEYQQQRQKKLDMRQYFGVE